MSDFKPARKSKRSAKTDKVYNDTEGIMDETELENVNTIVLQPVDLEQIVAEALEQNKPEFEAIGAGTVTGTGVAGGKSGPATISLRRVPVPPNRLSALKANWQALIEPLVTHMKLQVRFNTVKKCVEMRPAPNNSISTSLEKGCEYVKAFLLGFELADIMALLKLDDMYLQSFQVTDVKRLVNDNLSRAIGRIAGKDGKTRFAIENATRTRIVLQDKHVHLMGSHQNIILARDSICSLIIGAPPSKVYNHLRIVSRRMKERA